MRRTAACDIFLPAIRVGAPVDPDEAALELAAVQGRLAATTDQDRPALLERLGDLYTVLGQHRRAAESYTACAVAEGSAARQSVAQKRALAELRSGAFDEAAALLERIGADEGADSLMVLDLRREMADALVQAGHLESARDLLHGGLHLLRARPEPPYAKVHAETAHLLGVVAWLTEGPKIALPLFREALDRAKRVPALERRMTGILASVATIEIQLGDLQSAEPALRQAADLAHRLEDGETLSTAVHNRARVLFLRGDLAGAERAALTAMDHDAGAAYPRGVALNAKLLGDIALERGRSEEAEERYRQALGISCDTGDLWVEAAATVGFAEAALRQGRLKDAELWARGALAAAEERRLVGVIPRAHRVLGLRLALEKDWSGSRTSLTTAQSLAERADDPFLVGQVLLSRAQVEEAAGETAAAAAAAAAAQRLFEGMGAAGAAETAANVSQRLATGGPTT